MCVICIGNAEKVVICIFCTLVIYLLCTNSKFRKYKTSLIIMTIQLHVHGLVHVVCIE